MRTPQKVSPAKTETDSQVGSPRERPKFTLNHSGLILLGGGFVILVLLIFVTGLGVVSRANRLFREVATINTRFQRLSLDLERLRSDMFLVGSYVRDQLFDSESSLAEDRGKPIPQIAVNSGKKAQLNFRERGIWTTIRVRPTEKRNRSILEICRTGFQFPGGRNS